MATITLSQSMYEPLTLPSGSDSHTVVNDHSGQVEINEIALQSVGTEIRLQLVGHNGTPNVYLGTEGSMSIVAGSGNNRFPRITALDEVAVLTMTAGAAPGGGADAWVLTWE